MKRTLALAIVAIVVSGCAALPPPAPQSGALLRTETDLQALDETLSAILRTPLSADDAVRIALLNQRGLQARYWALGIARADLVQAGRLQNPVFGFKRSHQGAEVGIERTFTVNLVNLLTAPLAQRIEARRYAETKLLVANEVAQHAAHTRVAYYEAVAAQQGVAYAEQVNLAAEASAQLARRMADAGNWSQLDLAREQAFHADASADLIRATQQALSAREQLTKLMGLWGANAGYTLPPHLPELPASVLTLQNVEQSALRDRLDIQAAKLETEQTAAALGLSKTTRFVNLLELGYVNNSATGQRSAPGYELTLEIPLFDWGTARVEKAEAIYMQSVNKLAQAATEARSQARESYLAYRSSYDLARHYRDHVLPLRKKISNETLLRYNGMLLSVFELLADSRAQATAVNAYITALKQYWVAQANLDAALGGHLPAAAPTKDQS